MSKLLEPEELTKDLLETPSLMTGHSPAKEWMDTPAEFRPGNWAYSAKTKAIESLKLPYARDWSPGDEDWKLPENWKEIITRGSQEHAGIAGRAAQVDLPKRLHSRG